MNENEIRTETVRETEPTEATPASERIAETEAPETVDETEESASLPENGADETASGDDPDGENAPEETPDGDDERYRRQAESDLAELQRIDPAAAGYRHLGEMPGALRFAELRGLGLTVEEAYFAVRGAVVEKTDPDRGGRAHLHGSVPGRAASGGNGMTVGEIENARRLFPGLPDREIASLWRRVNEN
ncbi:MAG: hypothetical protein J6Z04_05310 [Clostridia bacterium]|nr:hypothetical protein [Clostridia bacterium]